MTDELEHLMENLKLKRMLSVLAQELKAHYDEQLCAAEKQDVTCSEFTAGLLRAQWHHWRKS